MISKTLLGSTVLLSLASAIAAAGSLSASFIATSDPASFDWKNTDVGIFTAVPTAEGGLGNLDAPSITNLKAFAAGANSNQKKAIVSVGGWEGSQYFSSLAKDDARPKFVKAITDFVLRNELHGVVVDWRSPGYAVGKNEVDPKDTANLLSLLKDLRTAVDSKWLAAQVSPYGLFSEDGKTAITDYTEFGTTVDAFNIMAYDYVGSWSPITGPDSPYQSCGTNVSIFSDIEHYTNNGFPVSKIILAVSPYSKDFTLVKPETPSESPIYGDQKPKAAQYWSRLFNVGMFIGKQPTYAELKKQGIISPSDDYSVKTDYVRNYDHCSKTPSLFQKSTQTFYVYLDRKAAATRARGAAVRGFLGVQVSRSDGFDTPVYDALKWTLANTAANLTGYWDADDKWTLPDADKIKL